MKYISPKIEILQTATADIIATSSYHTEIHRFGSGNNGNSSSYHTGIHRFGKSSTGSNYEGVTFTIFGNGIDEFFDL